MEINSNDLLRYYHDGLLERGGCGGPVMGFLVMLICVVMMCSCTTTRYVTIPEYHTEYKTRVDSFVQRDSIYTHDSVYVQRSGDTLLVEKWRVKYIDRWRDKVKIDTFIKTDSIRVPYPVEKELSWFQKLKVQFSEYVIGLLLIVIIVIVLKSKLRKP